MPLLLVLLTTVLFHLPGGELTEVSGIAHGQRSPGVYYVHNDSGNSARVYALDRGTGALRATYAVPGATNVDWEDIAVAKDASGTPSIWIADIGDNKRVRKSITIYRVNEPNVPDGVTGVHNTSAPDAWRLRYPDGAHDAEALLVEPTTHRAYIVTKSLASASSVYAVPAKPSNETQTLRKVGTVTIPLLVGGPRELAITGGSVGLDGKRMVLRTYTSAYLWPLQKGDVAGAFKTQPKAVDLPNQLQGEGITIDGARAVIVSEGAKSAVYAVSLPAARASPTTAPSQRNAAATTTGGDTDYTNAYLVGGVVALLALLGLVARTLFRKPSAQHR